MPETTARIAAGLLAATFAWAAVAKLVGYDGWRTALASHRFPATVERAARPAVPLAELAVAMLLIVGRSRAGAAVALALVALFSVAIARARDMHGDRLPCGCFGGREDRSAVAMMWRNGLLAILAIVIISSTNEPELFAGFRLPAGGEVLASVLVLAGVVIAVWMVWQIGASSRRRQVP